MSIAALEASQPPSSSPLSVPAQVRTPVDLPSEPVAAQADVLEQKRAQPQKSSKADGDTFVEDMSLWASNLLTNLVIDNPSVRTSTAPKVEKALTPELSRPSQKNVSTSRGNTSTLERQATLRAAAITIPHPDKVATGGEDAFFISDAGADLLQPFSNETFPSALKEKPCSLLGSLVLLRR